MKKSIFICIAMLFNTIFISCDKETNNDDLQLYNTENTFSTGDEDNEDDPDCEENKPKT